MQTAVIVLNWNGKKDTTNCLKALSQQSLAPGEIIVVDNGSSDGSVEHIKLHFPNVTLLEEVVNTGFAKGVNTGIRHAIRKGYDFVALLNNDAEPHIDWLQHLVKELVSHNDLGIVTCKLIRCDEKLLDSTGECYTTWGLAYPRGRDEINDDKYNVPENVFAATGGASLYRTAMLKEIGLFDEDFFAYYEDVDISFRAQLAAWQVRYVPEAIAYHQIGATSSKIKGFTTYQAMKNLPLLLYKNVPSRYLWRVGWRLTIARIFFLVRAISRGLGWYAVKGDLKATQLLFKKMGERRQIQKSRKVSDEYIWAMIVHDLPPNAHALRKLRRLYWKLTFRKNV